MALKQPSRTSQTNEYGKLKDSHLSTQFPKKALTNMMMFYFNTTEEVINASKSIDAPFAGEYLSYSGTIGGEVPQKNLSWIQIQQNRKIDTVMGSKYVSAVNDLFGGVVKKYKRTTTGIFMLPPKNIRYMTSAGWAPLDVEGNLLGILTNATLSVDQDQSRIKGALTHLTSVLGQESVRLLGGMLGDPNLGNALTKTVQNTFADMTFKGMSRRSFQFSWSLSPKNYNEVEAIDHIINKMRFHAHPTFADNSNIGNYLIFPGQVDIEWYIKDDDGEYIENAWLPKISTCVIENIETDFTPDQHFSFFKGVGAPTTSNLTITLTEVAPLLKEDIARGF